MVFDFHTPHPDPFLNPGHDDVGTGHAHHRPTAFFMGFKKKPWANGPRGLEALGAVKQARSRAAHLASRWQEIAQHADNIRKTCSDAKRFMFDYMLNTHGENSGRAAASLALASASACRLALGVNQNYIKLATSALLRNRETMDFALHATRRYIYNSDYTTLGDVNPGPAIGAPTRALYTYPLNEACKKPEMMTMQYKMAEDLKAPIINENSDIIQDNHEQLLGLQFL